jgi:Predicted phosphotransferase related to Ser/Thr protein kinases
VGVVENAVDERQLLMRHWLSGIFPKQSCVIQNLAGDASFRRYFRATVNDQTFVVMDAPPEKENCEPFVAIANAFENAPARFPKIISKNLAQGFLLLPDFGDQQLLPLLNYDSVDALYYHAMKTLLQIQRCSNIALPSFDDALYWREFDIFDQWYLQKNLGKNLSLADNNKLRAIYQVLIDSAHAQPQVFVHRDYHSRNIMLCDDGELGILDFQDAVQGPITYDLVSLLRDCYVAWPVDQTEKWVFDYYQKLNLSVDFKTFLRWFDWMGLQRHLKMSRYFFATAFSGW